MQNDFINREYDLGEATNTGSTRAMVSQSFLAGQYPQSNACLICGNASAYKIIPKNAIDNTVEIEDRGFVCENCLQKGYLDRNRYGIRELKR